MVTNTGIERRRGRVPKGLVSRRLWPWLVICVGVLTALVPRSAAAHERWFTPNGPYSAVEWDRIISLPVLLALISGAAVVMALRLGQRVTGDPLWPRPTFSQGLEPSAPAILGVQTAIAMIFAASRLNLFVPNIELRENVTGVLIAAIAAIAAFSFITGVLTRAGALVTIGLWLVAFAVAPWEEVLEQTIFVGIAVYLAVVGRGVVLDGGRIEALLGGLADRLTPYALPALRIGAGISVVVLALTEKLLNVDLGVAFLHQYPRFNVAHEAGITWFTDERFVYAAGIVEATAGVALLSGYLTRVVILALWIPFNLGIAFLPVQELIGHLPILSAMYVLLVRGTEGIPSRAEEAPAATGQVSQTGQRRRPPAVAARPG